MNSTLKCNSITGCERSVMDSMTDGETGTIIGKAHKQAIVSLTERKSGLALIYKVDRRTKVNTEGAIK